jgi:hypothetical protein
VLRMSSPISTVRSQVRPASHGRQYTFLFNYLINTAETTVNAIQSPRDLGKRESSSGVQSLGMEHPGAAIYFEPAAERACVHCL